MTMKTMVLETKLVESIARIGRDRAPAEACGILLPVPHRGHRVWEMPNRSMNMDDSFEMHGSDIALTLDDWDQPTEMWKQMVVWHTHPAGNLGPSKADMENRIDVVGNLVVTLMPDGTAKATWY